MTWLFHVVERTRWEQGEDPYGADLVARDGFLHLCRPDQLAGVLERHFSGQADLVVLFIAEDAVADAVRWEAPPGGTEAFPHLYRPLPRREVVSVRSVEEALPG